MKVRLPHPLWIFLTSLVLVTSAFAIPICVSAHREHATMRLIIGLGGEAGQRTRGPTWFRRLVGNWSPKSLDTVHSVNLSGTDFTDADLNALECLVGLEWLALNRSRLTNDGMRHLQGLSTLEALRIENTQVGDMGLESLKGLHRLRILSLRRTKVTDAGLPLLENLGSLTLLDLGGTAVTDAAVARFQKSCPKVAIRR